jgi:hypothetical protein
MDRSMDTSDTSNIPTESSSLPIFCNDEFDKLSQIELDRIQYKLRIGPHAGFLHPSETLTEVRSKDMKTLQHLKISPDQIANKMEILAGKYYRSNYLCPTKSSEPKLIESIFEITGKAFLGSMTCPFHDSSKDPTSHSESYSEITIKNKNTGKSIKYNSLMWHLIRNHQFFGGPLSSYRVDPTHIVDVFDIKPEDRFDIRYESTYVWTLSQSGPGYGLSGNTELLTKIALKSFRIDDYFKGFLMPYGIWWNPMANHAVIIKYLATHAEHFDWLAFVKFELDMEHKGWEDYPPYANLPSEVVARIVDFTTNGSLHGMTLFVVKTKDLTESQTCGLKQATINGIGLSYGQANFQVYDCTKYCYIPLDHE